MIDSILESIKKLLGPSVTDTYFDPDIIMHINSEFATLSQLGNHLPQDFEITGKSTSWNEYSSDKKILNWVKTYIYLRVKLVFDPPSNPSVIESMNRRINEMESRIEGYVDYEKTGGENK